MKEQHTGSMPDTVGGLIRVRPEEIITSGIKHLLDEEEFHTDIVESTRLIIEERKRCLRLHEENT